MWRPIWKLCNSGVNFSVNSGVNFCCWKSTAGVSARVAGTVSLREEIPPGAAALGVLGVPRLGRATRGGVDGDRRNCPGAAGKAWQLSLGITGASTEPGARLCLTSASATPRMAGSRFAGEAGAGQRSGGPWPARSSRGQPGWGRGTACGATGLGELCARRGKSHSEGLNTASSPVSPSEMSPEPSGTAPKAGGQRAGHGQGETPEL